MPRLSTLWLRAACRPAHGAGPAFRPGGPRPAGPVPRDDGAAPAGDDRPGRAAGRHPLAERESIAGHPHPAGRLPAAGRLLPMGL